MLVYISTTSLPVVCLRMKSAHACGPWSRRYAPNYVTSYLPDAAPDLWQQYLAIIFDGLRPAGAHTLPQPPPDIL